LPCRRQHKTLLAQGAARLPARDGIRIEKKKTMSRQSAIALILLSALAICNTMLAVAGGAALPGNATAWLAIGAIALFSTVMAVAAFLVGIKHIGAAQGSIISTLEPVITICLGVALLGESITATQLLGGAMVLAAVILLARRPVRGAPAGASKISAE
jgi:drug/metabolite transporter (DMT)-like permease